MKKSNLARMRKINDGKITAPFDDMGGAAKSISMGKNVSQIIFGNEIGLDTKYKNNRKSSMMPSSPKGLTDVKDLESRRKSEFGSHRS